MAIQVTDLHLLRDQLLIRRKKLETAVTKSQTANLVQLLEQVDRALERVDHGSFGICEVCNDNMEAERLLADPLATMCLDCLRPDEQRALEQDLELAARIQAGLLPRRDFSAAGWNVAYHYEPAGMVSGDYCDLIAEGKNLYFMIGDVSGKGVAAAMLMANLHAMFRALVPAGLPLEQLVERANRIFCESNGGHVPPFHVSPSQVSSIQTSTVPVGLFCDQKFSTTRIHMAPGDNLVLYTDCVSEAEDPSGTPYGASALPRLLGENGGRIPHEVVERCIKDLIGFRGGSPRLDDQTLLVLHFSLFPN